MDDLVRWLTAQLDADEARLRLALRDDQQLPEALRSAGDRVKDLYGDPDPPEEEVSAADRLWWLARDAADYIEHFGPARVLLEVDAKRRLLDDHLIVPRDVEPAIVNG
ncbi:DUF6221 family protein, partial [Streptomyces antibioticus]|uniref:DUF6221 family protein n=1 Tax=Streptomyces antibioticus TaxID=1890 RepID=UPI0033EA621E